MTNYWAWSNVVGCAAGEFPDEWALVMRKPHTPIGGLEELRLSTPAGADLCQAVLARLQTHHAGGAEATPTTREQGPQG